MELANPLIHKFDAIGGFVIAVLAYFLGPNWFLFAGFLFLNIVDWFTGWMKGRLMNKMNSSKGAKGILKKLGYWLMICVSFGVSSIFIGIGTTIGVDLQITTLLGWFVLASLIVNEVRSIIENFVEAGYNVPAVLTKGLEVAEQVLEKENAVGTLLIDRNSETNDVYHFHYDIPLEELLDKEIVTLRVDSNADLKSIREDDSQ